MNDGLTYIKVNQSDNCQADLVFIHGLTGDPKGTWTSLDGTEFWPEWLALDLSNLAIHSIGYPASIFAKWAKKEMDLFERAKSVLEQLAAVGIGERPVFFVVHSLGGILLKQMLRRAADSPDDGWKKIAAQCQLVIFMATPHTGAALAAVLNYAAPRISSSFISALTNDTGILSDINESYRTFCNNYVGLKTVVYYEKHKIAKMALVVPKESADPGITNVVPVPFDRDHIGICKPNNKDDVIYMGVRRHLMEALKKAGTVLGSDIFSHDDYDKKSEYDRRDLLAKLIDSGREHEYSRANDLQNKFAQKYMKLGLYTPAKEENDKLLAEVEQRFITHVYHPLICKNASPNDIRSALQNEVIDPICIKRTNQAGFSEQVVLKAIYFLTEQCHIRWDPEK